MKPALIEEIHADLDSHSPPGPCWKSLGPFGSLFESSWLSLKHFVGQFWNRFTSICAQKNITLLNLQLFCSPADCELPIYIFFFFGQVKMIFDSVDTYAQKRLSKEPSELQRIGNFDVFTDSENNDNDSEDEIIALCHIHLALSFTDGTGQPRRGGKYEEATAAALAVQHFNSRNASNIIADLGASSSALLENCPVKLSLEMHDSEFQESVTVEQVIRATDRPIDSNHTIRPCAFLGASRSAVTLPMSLITSLRGFPQLSASSTSAALDDTSQYPLFARTVPADDGTAIPVIQYMRYTLGIQYMTILNVGDSYGSGYVLGLQLAARRYAPDLFLQQVDIPVDASQASINTAVQLLKDTQNTFFFAIVYPTSTLDAVMTEAYRQGIAGTGRHNWFFSDATVRGMRFQK